MRRDLLEWEIPFFDELNNFPKKSIKICRLRLYSAFSIEALMKLSWFSFYNFILALWVGGIALFTFIVTPVIFKSYPRDLAGEIVGRLFSGYFLYNLVLAALVLVLFFIVANDRSKLAHRLSLMCVVTALLINLFIVFKLHPDTVRIKQQVTVRARIARFAGAETVQAAAWSQRCPEPGTARRGDRAADHRAAGQKMTTA